jgi:hypothetical protein
MHTFQLSPQLHNIVNMMKNLNFNSETNTPMVEKHISQHSLSKLESEAILKAFSQKSNEKEKSQKEPICNWG